MSNHFNVETLLSALSAQQNVFDEVQKKVNEILPAKLFIAPQFHENIKATYAETNQIARQHKGLIDVLIQGNSAIIETTNAITANVKEIEIKTVAANLDKLVNQPLPLKESQQLVESFKAHPEITNQATKAAFAKTEGCELIIERIRVFPESITQAINAALTKIERRESIAVSIARLTSQSLSTSRLINSIVLRKNSVDSQTGKKNSVVKKSPEQKYLRSNANLQKLVIFQIALSVKENNNNPVEWSPSKWFGSGKGINLSKSKRISYSNALRKLIQNGLVKQEKPARQFSSNTGNAPTYVALTRKGWLWLEQELKND